MSETVLVLLACKDGAEFIETQVDSILGQSNAEVEILISVDPSKDATRQIVDALCASHSNVRQLRHTHGAGGAARNFYRLITSCDLSRHTYVALADQDDIWFPDKLARAIDCLQSHGAAAYSSNVLAWGGSPESVGNLVDKAQPQTPWDYLFSSAGPGCTYVFTARDLAGFASWLAEHHDEAGRVDFHDWLLYAWFRANHRRWVIDPRPSMLYRQHGGNQIGANRGVAAWKKRLRELHNGWYEGQVTAIALAVGELDAPPLVALRSPRFRERLSFLSYASRLRRARGESFLVAFFALSSRRRVNRWSS